MQGDPGNATARESGHAGPYVGMRPYEGHEHEIFFGRDRDAEFLSDKILASRLTLLYGESGLGKSSLIRALVIPKLESYDSRVLYFDAWAGEHPTADLKSALLGVAEELSIPDAGGGAPTILELVRLIASADARGFILILDQFEEFLVSNAERLDPLKQELAALIRAQNVEVHVVISMREEFLAAMEPFHREILNLFQSTYRLEPLSDAGVRDAITEPVKLFDGSYEPELLEILIEDLRGKPAHDRRATRRDGAAPDRRAARRDSAAPDSTAPVELPMLQLVCSQIWAAARQRGEALLTTDLYRKRLGGYQKILEGYVRSVMPHSWRRKRLVARLMTFLAPPGGLKMSFSVSHLAQATELRPARIKAELEKLSKARVLRTRKYRSEERYEVQHDSLIKILAPWREQVLRQATRLRWAGWVSAALVAVTVVAASLYFYQFQNEWEQYRNTEGALGELRAMPEDQRIKLAPARFDSAALYLLWRQTHEERFDELKEILAGNEDLLPDGYGVDRSGWEYLAQPPTEIEWPLTLRYSSRRDLDIWYFTLSWQSYAKVVAESWGIPVPKRLVLVEDATLPRQRMRLTGLEIEPTDLDVPTHEDQAFIRSLYLDGPGREFFERFREDWTPLPNLTRGGPWWVVPRWSLPVWKASGETATDGSGLPALALAIHLLENPEPLLSPAAFEFLLDRVAETHPQTVAEARAARGDRLAQDLGEIIKLERGLSHLEMVLDALARYPGESSATVAEAVNRDLMAAEASLPERLFGPWRPDSGQPQSENRNDDDVRKSAEAAENTENGSTGAGLTQAYQEVADWLPAKAPVVRVYLGRDLEERWISDDAGWASLSERVERIRNDMQKHFGIPMPGVRFRGFDWDRSLAPSAFRIEVLNQIASDPDAQPVFTSPDTALDQLIHELEYRALAFRTYWLDADTAYWRRESLDPALRQWLDEHYSLTDYKLLLRAVVSPTQWELDDFLASSNVKISEPFDGNTLRNEEWLLESLVFWSRLGDALDLNQIAADLRLTQQTRITSSASDGASIAPDHPVSRGIMALADRKFAAAQDHFDRAIAQDADAAIEAFLILYPLQLHSRTIAALDTRCDDPTTAWLSREERIELESVINDPRLQLADDKLRVFRLCLFANLSQELDRQKKREIAAALVDEHGSREGWPPDDAFWFAREMFKDYDPLTQSADTLDKAARFLKGAVAGLDENAARSVVWEFGKICQEPGPRNWCWILLNDLAETRPNLNNLLDLALLLSTRERREDLERAAELAERAESAIAQSPDLPDDERVRLTDFSRYYRARALAMLADHGQDKLWGLAESSFETLLDSPTLGDLAKIELASLRIDLGRYGDAEPLLDGAIQQDSKDPSVYLNKMWTQLLRGDIDGAASTVERARRLAEDDDGLTDADTMWFVAALGQILTRTGDWEETSLKFLERDHVYAHYIAMILYASMVGPSRGDAEHFLNNRWDKVKGERPRWQERLRHGDDSVWREMLIGFYIGEVPDSDILGPLTDPAAFKAGQFSKLSLPRIGMLCEAYFYDALLAKSRDDKARMIASLGAVIATNKRSYLEYKMAKFMLAAEGEGSP